MGNKDFDLQYLQDEFYDGFDIRKTAPVIGITTNFENEKATLAAPYYEQVVRAGGIPLLIPPISEMRDMEQVLSQIDGLILSGGADINPLWMGEQPHVQLGEINAKRDRHELLITILAHNRQMPILGICRGMQTIAAALGGSVIQYLSTTPQSIKHSQDADKTHATHTVSLESESIIARLYDSQQICVNSFHHQAVGRVPEGMKVTGTAPDGVIEAMEDPVKANVVAVQWHPEHMGDHGLKLFDYIVKRASLYREATQIHKKYIIFDSHCDTPMTFYRDMRFDKRKQDVLVDQHKMYEGQLDAVTMVAYLPQPAPGETFGKKDRLGFDDPWLYTLHILDGIDKIILDNQNHIASASTPREIAANKDKGLKSIVKGIENGLAIEKDLTRIPLLAERDITYITLCHNGDNDICDSARRSQQTHGGVSAFGSQVISEMNKHGIMCDLSHASEKSFYDALDISRVPVVCSHSCCRSLCDSPRNLTDDQMKALAAKGGVLQITIYNGFLKTSGQATLHDFIAHLRHAIDIMGIEHVGIGSDFDGDGGVPGIANAAEIKNITMALLQKNFSHQDIKAIWGGNWFRVMQDIQQNKK